MIPFNTTRTYPNEKFSSSAHYVGNELNMSDPAESMNESFFWHLSGRASAGFEAFGLWQESLHTYMCLDDSHFGHFSDLNSPSSFCCVNTSFHLSPYR